MSRELVHDDLALIDALQHRIDRLDGEIHQRARSGPRARVLAQLPGIGPFTALVILAEIGDIGRFGPARKQASWAGLTPTVRGSDRVAHYGHISEQDSVWLRWVPCEAAQTARRHPQFAASFQAIARRRGRKIATTAAHPAGISLPPIVGTDIIRRRSPVRARGVHGIGEFGEVHVRDGQVGRDVGVPAGRDPECSDAAAPLSITAHCLWC